MPRTGAGREGIARRQSGAGVEIYSCGPECIKNIIHSTSVIVDDNCAQTGQGGILLLMV